MTFWVFFSIYNIKALSSFLKNRFIYLYVFLYQVSLMAKKLIRGFLLSLAWSIDNLNRARHSQCENEANRYRHIGLRKRQCRVFWKNFFIFETVTAFQSLQVNYWKNLRIGANIYLYIKLSKDCVIIVICFHAYWCLTTRPRTRKDVWTFFNIYLLFFYQKKYQSSF